MMSHSRTSTYDFLSCMNRKPVLVLSTQSAQPSVKTLRKSSVYTSRHSCCYYSSLVALCSLTTQEIKLSLSVRPVCVPDWLIVNQPRFRCALLRCQTDRSPVCFGLDQGIQRSRQRTFTCRLRHRCQETN